jgi:uncharacterized membrane protein
MNRFDLRAGAALAGPLLLAMPIVQVAHDFADARPMHIAMALLGLALIAVAGAKARAPRRAP